MEQDLHRPQVYDYRQYDQVWQRVAPTLEPYPGMDQAAPSAPEARAETPPAAPAPPPPESQPSPPESQLPGAQPNPCCSGCGTAPMTRPPPPAGCWRPTTLSPASATAPPSATGLCAWASGALPCGSDTIWRRAAASTTPGPLTAPRTPVSAAFSMSSAPTSTATPTPSCACWNGACRADIFRCAGGGNMV